MNDPFVCFEEPRVASSLEVLGNIPRVCVALANTRRTAAGVATAGTQPLLSSPLDFVVVLVVVLLQTLRTVGAKTTT